MLVWPYYMAGRSWVVRSVEGTVPSSLRVAPEAAILDEHDVSPLQILFHLR